MRDSVSDKKGNKLKFYSCSNLWRVLFPHPDIGGVVLKPGKPGNLLPDPPFTQTGDGGDLTFEVFLGPPILQQKSSRIEADPDTAFKVLKAWIRLDADNIVRRRLGRIAECHYRTWRSNFVPREEGLFHGFFYGPNYRPAEKALEEMLTALGHNYRNASDCEKYNAVRELLKLLPKPLNPHAEKMVDGAWACPQSVAADGPVLER